MVLDVSTMHGRTNKYKSDSGQASLILRKTPTSAINNKPFENMMRGAVCRSCTHDLFITSELL